MKANERGFGSFELILIVIILAGIGFIGWWLLRSHPAARPEQANTFASAKPVSFVGGNLTKSNLNNATTKLDVANCPVGQDSLDYGQGKSDFLIKGKQGSFCVFSYGTAAEGQSEPVKLGVSCKVPTTFSSGLSVNSTFGVDLTPIKAFCSS